MQITYCAASSLDGFIARVDGDVSWLDEMNISPNETGLEEFFQSVGGLVMGRKTYDFVFNFGSWPYEDKPTWIVTHRDIELLDGANLIIAGDIDNVIGQAATRGISHIWLVGGGQLASSFLAKDLLTHLSITEMPIKLESGIPLFSNHHLDEIAFTKRHEIERGQFRQIEITVARDRDRSGDGSTATGAPHRFN